MVRRSRFNLLSFGTFAYNVSIVMYVNEPSIYGKLSGQISASNCSVLLSISFKIVLSFNPIYSVLNVLVKFSQAHSTTFPIVTLSLRENNEYQKTF